MSEHLVALGLEIPVLGVKCFSFGVVALLSIRGLEGLLCILLVSKDLRPLSSKSILNIRDSMVPSRQLAQIELLGFYWYLNERR